MSVLKDIEGKIASLAKQKKNLKYVWLGMEERRQFEKDLQEEGAVAHATKEGSIMFRGVEVLRHPGVSHFDYFPTEKTL